ncbi:MAG: hypothetical protein PHS45_01455 [Bacilli bacterium]|nr:hypothetical protein [Bacilli bacterium]
MDRVIFILFKMSKDVEINNQSNEKEIGIFLDRLNHIRQRFGISRAIIGIAANQEQHDIAEKFLEKLKKVLNEQVKNLRYNWVEFTTEFMSPRCSTDTVKNDDASRLVAYIDKCKDSRTNCCEPIWIGAFNYDFKSGLKFINDFYKRKPYPYIDISVFVANDNPKKCYNLPNKLSKGLHSTSLYISGKPSYEGLINGLNKFINDKEQQHSIQQDYARRNRALEEQRKFLEFKQRGR